MKPLGIVVDDDNPSRKIYGSMLINLGFDVLEAIDGEQALTLLQQHQPQIVLLDMRLPKVNGQTVLEYIYDSQHLVNTHVFIISAHTEYKYTVPLRAGDAYFVKPVPSSEVREMVMRTLNENPG
jgi:CheY-like chemotaxis protein